jgi:nitroreductase
MDLKKAIHSRRSVRKFSKKKPDWRDIIEAIDSARYSPMTGGNCTLKFILVDDKAKILKIAESTQQDFVKTVDFLVVVCSKPSRTINAYGEKGEIYFRQQAGAAIENFLLSIQEKNLATCWVGHFVEGEVKRVLEIPDGVHVEALFPIGYEFSKPKTRKEPIDLDKILYFNKYKNKKMKEPKRFNV